MFHGQRRLKENLSSLLQKLTHRMQIRRHLQRHRNDTFALFALTLSKQLLEPFGEVPQSSLILSARSFGYMVYFFEKACAVSCYLTGVNPFDQPGVEDYCFCFLFHSYVSKIPRIARGFLFFVWALCFVLWDKPILYAFHKKAAFFLFMSFAARRKLTVSELSARSFGYMVYFFEKACAVSCYLTGVNPFDQPGVEDYKRNIKIALQGEKC